MSEVMRLEQAIISADKAGDVQAAQTIGQALKKLRQSSAAPQAASAEIPMLSQRQPTQPQSQPSPIQAPQDNAFEYSVDQAQRMVGKGVEAVGRKTGIQQVEDFGTQTVEQQDQDIKAGGYTPDYTSTLRDTWNTQGYKGALGWLAEKTAENSVSGGTALAGGIAAAAVAPVSMPAALAVGGTTLLGNMTLNTGAAAFEQEQKLGNYDETLAIGAGVISGILDRFGASKVISPSMLKNMTPSQMASTLQSRGFSDAAAEVLKKTSIEAATEVAQDATAIGSAAIQGGQYTQGELIDRGIESAALGSTHALAAQTALGTGRAAKRAVIGKNEAADYAAAASLSDKIKAKSDMGYDLQNINSSDSFSARDALDGVHKDIVGEMKTHFDILAKLVKTDKDRDNLQALRSKMEVRVAFDKAKNKVKNTVDKSDFASVENLVGEWGEGQALLNSMREMNELTRVVNTGLKGGVSQYTDALFPFASGNSQYIPTTPFDQLRALGTGGLAASTGGTSLVYQAGGAAAGRLIDSLTGRRSRVAKYVKDNSGKGNLPAITAPSYLEYVQQENLKKETEKVAAARVVSQERQAKVLAKEAVLKSKALQDAQKTGNVASVRAFANAQDPSGRSVDNTSPEGVFSLGTGLDRQGVLQVLPLVITQLDNNPDPAAKLLAADLKAIVTNITEGTTPELTDFSSIIQLTNTFLDSNPELAKLRKAPPDRPLFRAVENPANSSGLSNAAERGKNRNIATVQKAIDEVNNASQSEITPLQKTQLISTLTIFKEPQNNNILEVFENEHTKLKSQGVPQNLINKFILPYLQKVRQQQM
jgi:hypothetical protein